MASSRFLTSRLVVPCTEEVGKRMEASLPTLNRLLDVNAEQFDMEYGPNRFSNHMTHGLVALWSLGASDQTLEGFFEHYRRNTHPNSGYPIETLKPPAPLFSSLPPGVTVDEPSTASTPTPTPTPQHFVPWSQVMLHWRGEGGNFSGLLAYFKAVAHRLVALGVDPTIEQATHRLLVFHAPHLLQGLLGGAFHGIIQIGYALEVGHQASVMLGLAYFTETYLSLGVPTEGPAHRHAQGASAFVFEPAEDLAKLREEVLKRYDGQLPEDVTREVKFVRRAERVRNYLKELLNSADLGLEAWFRKHYNDEEDPSRFAQVLDLTCQKITDAINRVYACSNDDFFVIHLVTGWRSLRQVLKAFKAPPAPAAQSDSISDLIDNQEYARLVSSPKQLAFAAARMMDSYWRAVVVSYLCRDFPVIDASWFSLPDSQAVPSWEQIREHTLHLASDEKARALTDEHVYKIVHVLQQDVAEGYYSKSLFDLEEIDHFSRLLAARKAGILPWKLP